MHQFFISILVASLMLLMMQGRRLVTNFQMSCTIVTFNGFMSELLEITGLCSWLNLDQTQCSIISEKLMNVPDDIKGRFNLLQPSNYQLSERNFFIWELLSGLSAFIKNTGNQISANIFTTLILPSYKILKQINKERFRKKSSTR